MTVAEIITKLQQVDQSLQVRIPLTTGAVKVSNIQIWFVESKYRDRYSVMAEIDLPEGTTDYVPFIYLMD